MIKKLSIHHKRSSQSLTESSSSASSHGFTPSTSATNEFASKVQHELTIDERGAVDKKTLQSAEFTLNKLNLKEVGLVGREQEAEKLESIFRGVIVAPEESDTLCTKMVVVKGSSGTGKTVLAMGLERHARQNSGICCVGKFDWQHRVEPYTAFVASFSDLSDQILSRGDEFVAEMREKIKEEIGETRHVLSDIVPKLAPLLGESSRGASKGQAGVGQRANQLHFLFRKLIQVICRDRRPLVVVLDDLQWADSASLELLQALLTDETKPALFVVATMRDNEVDVDHPVAKQIMCFRENGVSIEEIVLGNLDIASVESIVATCLRANVEETKRLADVIFEKTLGNPFFTVQFLQSLVDEELLTFNFGVLRWSWDDEKLRGMVVADNVADLLTQKLKRLPSDIQMFLQVASCLGRMFDRDTLHIGVVGARKAGLVPVGDNEEALCIRAVDEGLLQPNGLTYVFVHDQIQAAVFDTIRRDVALSLQATIGRELFDDDLSEDKRLFLAVDLSNKALPLLGGEEKLRLAKMNLAAGERSLRKSAFLPARRYMESGLTCLEGVDGSKTTREWTELACGMAEATYSQGDFETMQAFVDDVLRSPCELEDVVRVQSVKILAFAAQKRFHEAISTGVSVLRSLGMRLSESPDVFAVAKDVMQTMLLMRRYSQDDIINLPEMTDTKKLQALQILSVMISSTYSVEPRLFLVSCLTIVRWSITYGVSHMSPFAFASLGFALCSMHDVKQGGKFSDIALALSDRLDARDTLARTILAVYGYLDHWRHDLRSSIKPLLFGYQVGMQFGDLEMAFMNLSFYDMARFCTATRRLDKLAVEMESHINSMVHYKQEMVVTYSNIHLQLVLNLLGECDDPAVMTGRAFDKDQSNRLTQEDERDTRSAFNALQMQLAFLFGEYKLASVFATKVKDFGKENRGAILVPRVATFRALCALALASLGVECRKNLRRASKLTRTIQKWYEQGNLNVMHSLKLLEAETYATTHDKPENARVKYTEAIQAAARMGYLQDRALAHDCAGRYFAGRGNDAYWAAYHIQNAIECYQEWGATGLVQHLRKHHKALLLEAS